MFWAIWPFVISREFGYGEPLPDNLRIRYQAKKNNRIRNATPPTTLPTMIAVEGLLLRVPLLDGFPVFPGEDAVCDPKLPLGPDEPIGGSMTVSELPRCKSLIRLN